VPGDRHGRILKAIERASQGGTTSVQLCEVAAEFLGVAGAGIMLMSGDAPRGSLCSSNEVSRLIEELQYTLGEGPCVDAHRMDQVVLEPDLASPATPRWLAFTPRAVEAGVGAIFGFPLRLGSVRLGALNLHREEAGPLTDDQHADALVLTEVIVKWVLDEQTGAPPDTLSPTLESGSDFHFVVHNAAGMVSVQLGISVTEALIRLRAFAFSQNRLVREVADDIVARRLRL
jgi:hypothetical protein